MVHSIMAKGEITGFKNADTIDIVVGEAGGAYFSRTKRMSILDRFTRTIIFIKPELIIIYDRLAAKEPVRFEYWLHGIEKFDRNGQHRIRAKNGDVYCEIDFLIPGRARIQPDRPVRPKPVAKD